jgi:restriction endonuclease Mrr
MTTLMSPLPYDVLEAMVQCFGRCFHYKDGMASFLLSAGVPKALVDQYRNEAKFKWARNVLTDVGQSEDGCLTQRRVLTQLCNLRDVVERDVPDRDAGLDALRALKQLAVDRDLVVRKQREKDRSNAQVAAERERLLQERADKLATLRKEFTDAITTPDRQAAGYSLEDLLVGLFALFELEYRRSYRTPTGTQQIDGQFTFEGFHYLVEAKWRKNYPPEQEIAGFKHKVDGKLESTRGVFISVTGYRPAVIEQFNGRGSNIILLDGSHLIHVLEGRMDLREMLKLVIEKAAQEGVVYSTPWTKG